MQTTLRPLTLGEILDRTAELYRTNFLLLAGISSVYSGILLVLGLVQIGVQRSFSAMHMSRRSDCRRGDRNCRSGSRQPGERRSCRGGKYARSGMAAPGRAGKHQRSLSRRSAANRAVCMASDHHLLSGVVSLRAGLRGLCRFDPSLRRGTGISERSLRARDRSEHAR